jgi:hypothetical protein
LPFSCVYIKRAANRHEFAKIQDAYFDFFKETVHGRIIFAKNFLAHGLGTLPALPAFAAHRRGGDIS